MMITLYNIQLLTHYTFSALCIDVVAIQCTVSGQ